MTLPNFIVLGAPKCGTTSLHLYLSEHPEIFMTEQKEIHFFLSDDAHWGTWNRGLEWYSSLFKAGKSYPMRGEASPGYVIEGQTEDAAKKISEVLPEVKLIYLIRDPIRRTKSHFLESYFLGYLPKGICLDDIISNRGINDRPHDFYYKDFVYTSLYNRQLRLLLKHHDLNNIFIATQEQLQTQPQRILTEIFNFLGIDSAFIPMSLNTRLNVSSEKQKRVIDPLRFLSNSSLYRKLSAHVPDGFKDAYRKVISKVVDVNKLTELSIENEEHLQSLFRTDIQEFEFKTSMVLSNWLTSGDKLK